jgi:predicted ATPase
MLERVEIENYKAFRRYELALGSRVLLIGPNNAGKSTLVSALRLIAHLVRRK